MATPDQILAASRYRAGGGALFTSSKCPPGPGLENSCQLPFGFIYTPLSPPDNIQVVPIHDENLPPVICLTCLSYLNLYCDVDETTGVWTCALCGCKNAAPPESFHNGTLSPILISPIVEFRQPIAEAHDRVNTISVVVVMDANLPRAEAQAVGSALQAILPEMADAKTRINLGFIVFSKHVSIYQLNSTGVASADIFSTHEGLTEKHLESRQYLTEIGQDGSLECMWRCLSAVYGVVLDNEEGSEINVSKGKQLSRLEQLKQRKETRMRKELERDDDDPDVVVKSPWVLAKENSASRHPLRCTGEAIQCAIDLVASPSNVDLIESRILVFTNGCPNYGDGSVVYDDREMTTTARARPTADVVDPLKLSGAVEYFSIIAKAAVEGGIAIDVCCSGASELCLPVFQALVEPSSGYVLPHETFAGPHLKNNMNHFLKETNMTMAACSESQAEKSKSLAPSGCTIDIRMPSFVNPTHLVGPGEILDDFKGLLLNERSAFAAGCKLAARLGMRTNHLPQKDFVDDAVTRLSMGRKDPLSTFSVMLEINNFFQKDAFAFFQCITRFVDRRGQILITRVFSHRISIANDVGEFLDSIDEEVVPVVLGKEAVYRSMYGREIDARNEDETEVATSDELDDLAYDAQKDLDATIHRISVAFRLLGLEQGNRGLDLTEEGGIRTVGSSIDFAFPPELSDALRRLYHLRRGPLLSPGPMRSDDDRAQIRSLFLRLPLEDCLCMCAPSLWRTEVTPECKSDSVEWIAVPPESLALWDKTAIVADCYHSLFIWFGRGVPESFFDSIRQQARTYLLDRSVMRFPMAEIYTVSEGESMDRRFTALLAPSYGDPVDHQVANFPALGQLSPQELESLRCKFRFYDPTSDPSFRTWFWDVASATSSSKEFGLSLCE